MCGFGMVWLRKNSHTSTVSSPWWYHPPRDDIDKGHKPSLSDLPRQMIEINVAKRGFLSPTALLFDAFLCAIPNKNTEPGLKS